MILEKSDYWASCKATLIPCFVILELMPADTVLGGTGDTAGGKGPRSPGSRACPSCGYWATVSTRLSGRHHVKPVVHSPAVQAPEAAFPSALAPQPMTSYSFPDAPPATWLWHLSTLHPAGHTSPSMRPESQPCGQGKGSSKSVPSLGAPPQSTRNGCSLRLHFSEMYWPLFVVNQSHY